MATDKKPAFFTLLLMISFASVNAVMFTPALPEITKFFAITADRAQATVAYFLIGYAVGQLIYGPLSNRFGRKPALYAGILLQIGSSLLCVLAGSFGNYAWLVFSRFLLAFGSGVGLKMTITLINECYDPKVASQKMSYLMLAFAITPGIGVAVGGLLTTHYGWQSCFIAGAVYGVILFLMATKLPETQKIVDKNALKLKHLYQGYHSQIKNRQLVAGGVLMGLSTTFVYVFATLAPFVAIEMFKISPKAYGFFNLLPGIGLVIGSLISAQLARRHSLRSLIQAGILICCIGSLWMVIAALAVWPLLLQVFLPMVCVYAGIAFVLPNASALAMSHVKDKSHGAAVMSFINMGFATLVVLALGYFPVTAMLLPCIFMITAVLMIGIYRLRH